MQRVGSKIEDAVLIEVNGTAVGLRHIVRQLGVDDLRFFDRFARGELIRQRAKTFSAKLMRGGIDTASSAWKTPRPGSRSAALPCKTWQKTPR